MRNQTLNAGIRALLWPGGIVLVMACLSQVALSDSDLDAKRDVRQFLDHYISTLESGEEEGIRALFAEDDRFAWFTDGAQSYGSAEDVLAGMARFSGIQFHTALSDIRVDLLNQSWASASSSFLTKLTIPGQEDVQYGGVITWLLEKDSSSGTWKVLLGHTSTPEGPPGAGN